MFQAASLSRSDQTLTVKDLFLNIELGLLSFGSGYNTSQVECMMQATERALKRTDKKWTAVWRLLRRLQLLSVDVA